MYSVYIHVQQQSYIGEGAQYSIYTQHWPHLGRHSAGVQRAVSVPNVSLDLLQCEQSAGPGEVGAVSGHQETLRGELGRLGKLPLGLCQGPGGGGKTLSSVGTSAI